MPFVTRCHPESIDALAPDGSEIRAMAALTHGSVAHGLLAPGVVSTAIRHRTVEEIWYVIAGCAEIWRKLGIQESVEVVHPRTALTIPVDTQFQFRTVGDVPFEFMMCTMPPWPGADEAIIVQGKWSMEITSL